MSELNITTDSYGKLFSDESTSSAPIYVRVNEKFEMLVKWTLIFAAITHWISAFIILIAAILFYYIKDGYVETGNLHRLLKLK